MSEHRVAGPLRRSLRRYGRTAAIHAATTLLTEQYGLDTAQAVAQLVRLSKQHNDSLEAAARICVATCLHRNWNAGATEPADDQPDERRMRTQWVGDGVRAAVA